MEDIDGRTIKYKFSRVNKYIYAKCRERGCRAYLRYRMEELSYILSSANTHHNHRTYPSKTYMFKAVEDYLATLPKEASLLNLKHAVCQSFRITSKQFYYVLSRINKAKPTFEEYTAQIEKEGFDVYVSRE